MRHLYFESFEAVARRYERSATLGGPVLRNPVRIVVAALLGLLLAGVPAHAQTESATVPAQTHEWTWMGGSEWANQAGTYGTLGVFSTSNMPGARTGAVAWTDHQGNFWLFGGTGTAAVQVGSLNDLWELKPSTGEWAWMGGSTKVGQKGVYGTRGVASASNVPGARSLAAGGTDLNGNLWLFGGGLNDLWEFNPSTKEWTWVSGSNLADQPGVYGQEGVPAADNVPGDRTAATLWFDLGGNLWLFGGSGLGSSENGGSGVLNDLWKFNLATKQWAWMSGDSAAGPPGVYGKLRIPAASNVPGGRSGATGWVDSSGNLWLLGGLSVSMDAGLSELNDLWKFDTTTREWTWMSGSTPVPCPMDEPPCGNAGIYGKLGVPSGANSPGGRDSAIGWTDRSGNFWLFGGNGFDSTGTDFYEILGELNDLWVFSPTTNEWTWMGGSSTLGEVWSGLYAEAGVYGTLGVPSATNVPGSRASAANWVDESGNLWLLGGEGFDSTAFHSPLNDLWRYTLPATLVPCATPIISPSSGTYPAPLEVTISDSTDGAVIYYTLGGSAPSASSLPYNGPITIEANTTVRAIAVAVGYLNSAVSSAEFTIELFVATPTFSLPGGVYGAGQLVTISDATSGAVIFFTIDGSTPTTHSIRYTSPLLINATTTIKAIAVASGYSNSGIASSTYAIASSPSVLSDPATNTSANRATLNAVANDWGAGGTGWFHYGTSASALTLSTAHVALPAATSAQSFSTTVGNLQSNTVYYFEPVVSSIGGTSYGRVLSFTTQQD